MFVIALLSACVLLGCSSEEPLITATGAPTNTGGGGCDCDTTVTDCWQVTTDLVVTKGPKDREDSGTFTTGADGGAYHVFLRVLWDTRKEYLCWVAFTYADGTERQFAVPDPHQDRPVELVLDVGTARVEALQKVRLWRQKQGDPHGSAETGTIRLREIKGCRTKT